MGVSMNGVAVSDPISVVRSFDLAAEVGYECEVNGWSLTARESPDGTGIAVEASSPGELLDWLARASNAVLQLVAEERAVAGTAAACGGCGAAAGVDCKVLLCTGRLLPTGVGGEDEALDARIAWEDQQEQAGHLPADERVTCHTCRVWVADRHAETKGHWAAIDRASRRV